jgi:hypothetical protein
MLNLNMAYIFYTVAGFRICQLRVKPAMTNTQSMPAITTPTQSKLAIDDKDANQACNDDIK